MKQYSDYIIVPREECTVYGNTQLPLGPYELYEILRAFKALKRELMRAKDWEADQAGRVAEIDEYYIPLFKTLYEFTPGRFNEHVIKEH